MKIKRTCIENFGSIKRVELDELTNLTILVGKNGSGKSFIVEALHKFFDEFSAIGGTPASWDENLWFDRDADKPITIALWLDMEPEEIDKAFAEPLEELAQIRKTVGEGSHGLQRE